MRRWHVASWRVGLASRAGRPAPVAELAERGAPIVGREPAAATTAALTRALREAGCERLPGGPVARGHLDVARWVAGGGPDTGLTMEPAAVAFDLGFAALEAHVVELWVAVPWVGLPAATALVEALGSRALAARVALLPGYDLTGAGDERSTAASR